MSLATRVFVWQIFLNACSTASAPRVRLGGVFFAPLDRFYSEPTTETFSLNPYDETVHMITRTVVFESGRALARARGRSEQYASFCSARMPFEGSADRAPRRFFCEAPTTGTRAVHSLFAVGFLPHS